MALGEHAAILKEVELVYIYGTQLVSGPDGVCKFKLHQAGLESQDGAALE